MFSHSKKDRLRQLAKEVISNSRDWAHSSQDWARTGSRRARRFINKKPTTATLVALGVGYLLGKLFSKKHPAAALPAPATLAKHGR